MELQALSQGGAGGAVRFYQTYYRDPPAAFCPSATFNVTNGWRQVW